jgi:hypothetical protein
MVISVHHPHIHDPGIQYEPARIVGSKLLLFASPSDLVCGPLQLPIPANEALVWQHWKLPAHTSHRTSPADQRRQRQVAPAQMMGRFHVGQDPLEAHVGEWAPGAGGLLGWLVYWFHMVPCSP